MRVEREDVTGTGDAGDQDDRQDHEAATPPAEDRLEIEWRAVIGDVPAHQRAWLQSSKAVHLHGSLGTTRELPLAEWWSRTPHMALVDGPTEVHRRTVAKGALRDREPAPGLFPTEHIPTRLAALRERGGATTEAAR